MNFQILRRLESAVKDVDFTQFDFSDNARKLHSVKDYHYEEFVMPEKIPELPSPKVNPLRHAKLQQPQEQPAKEPEEADNKPVIK